MSDDALPSEGSAVDEAPTETPAAAPVRPARPPFKFSTFLLTFLFVIGIYMLFDTQARIAVARAIGSLLYPVIGFGGHYLLLTMFLAAVIEMTLTAVAYNATTDWVKAARVAKWNAAFRKVQMEALRSGKKDRIASLAPHQKRLTALSGEVSIAQLKGMAVTWFLVIAIYTWVGLTITSAATSVVIVGGASADLAKGVGGISFLPLWFLLFSLYTIPTSIVLRRVLKHYWLKRHLTTLPPLGSESAAVGGGA